jgi:phosphoserine phosphatase RsbU/P
VTKKSSAQLRLHVEELPDEQPALDTPQLAALCRAFEQATGWSLRYERGPSAPGEAWSTTIDDGRGQSAGRLVLSTAPRAPSDGSHVAAADPSPMEAIDLHAARPLALALGGVLGEANRLRRALWLREAELAAGVPVASRPGTEPHLAERLEGVLKGGAEAVGCQAAGLYLLDENTSELKLRASFGMPRERLLAPPRPLRGAVADLEALVGHAVVLEDTSQLPHWRCPEEYRGAVCVPVSSPSMPLGTLWVYSVDPRDFAPEETNLIEIIAGRLAADLEREMLLVAGTEAKSRDKQFGAAARWLEGRLPSVAPLLDDYDLAGWTRLADGVGGDFHDWSVLPDGRLAVAIGDSQGGQLEAALGATALQAALKSHAGYRHSAEQLLLRVNETLWTASPGEHRSSLAYALVEPDAGRVELTLAGDVAAIVVSGDDREVFESGSVHLGEGSEARFPATRCELAPGCVLLLLSSGTRAAIDAAGLRIGEEAFASLVARHPRDSADGLVARLRRLLDHPGQLHDDLTVLVVKRR